MRSSFRQLGDVAELHQRMRTRVAETRRSAEARGGNISHEQREQAHAANLTARSAERYIARHGATRRTEFERFCVGEAVRALATGRAMPAEVRSALPGLIEGSGTGQVATPAGFDTELVQNNSAYAPIEPLAGFFQSEPGPGNELDVVAVDSYATAGIVNEKAGYSESAPSFVQYQADGYKVGYLAGASDEFVADMGVDMAAFVEALARPIQVAINGYLCTGSGSGEPEGLTSNSVATTAAATGTITTDELMSLYHALPPFYRPNSSWVMHSGTLEALAVEAVVVSEGVVRPVVRFPDDNPGDPLIAGRPVVVTDDMPELGAGNATVYLGDIGSNLLVRRVGTTNLVVLKERYAEYGQTAFRIDRRVDAKIVDVNAGVLLEQAAS